MKIYPAYGRTIARLVNRGLRPVALGVLFSKWWSYFDEVPRVCLRPDEWEAGKWEFGYLRNQHVVAIWGEDVTPLQFAELVLDLMRAGPRLLWTCDHSGQWQCKEDDPFTVGSWLLAFSRHYQLTETINAPAVHAARGYFDHAAGRAADQDLKVMERITAKGGDLISWYNAQQDLRARAERMFSQPYPVPEDALAG